MNDGTETPGPADEFSADHGPGFPRATFFQRTDWLSFGLSTAVALAVYLYTIAPEVTLEWSGMYATGAMYAGVGPPPGFPTWTIYAWVFTKIVPFSNIAWRVAVSSAVAGALVCGLIALMVSRGSAMLLESTRGFRRLAQDEESKLRLICGIVAGLGFGFHGVFWGFAVIVETQALGLLLMSIVLCLLLRWAYAPRQTRYLYAAAFTYGLTLTVRISLAALAPALPFVVLFLQPAVGRDLFVLITAALGAALLANQYGKLPVILSEAGQFAGLRSTYLVLAIVFAIMSARLVMRSRRLLARWRTVFVMAALTLCGLVPYFYLALASMTNPPVNNGYARTVQGFIHLISRGQFERIHPADLLARPADYLNGVWDYLSETFHSMGWVYLVPIVVPCFLWHRVRGRARGWLLGLIASFCALSLFMLAMLNPRGATWSLIALYFPASHLVLTIWAGYGLVFLGTIVARARKPSVSRV